MQIFTNHFYEKGHSHEVCQDYALSVQNKDYAFFVVSDGCGSAKNSEIGSMVMSHSFKASYKSIWHEGIDLISPLGKRYVHGRLEPIYAQKILSTTLSKAQKIATSLDVNFESLYATILFGSYEKKSKKFSLFAWGDGVFVVVYKDKTYKIINIEYENNAPYYMQYDYTTGTFMSYIESFGGKSTITTCHYNPDREIISKKQMDRDYPSPYELKLEGDVTAILGLSDGVQSFKEDFTSVVNKCIDFKNVNTTFIERRLKRLMKEKAKSGDLPYDDFSCAGIYVK